MKRQPTGEILMVTLIILAAVGISLLQLFVYRQRLPAGFEFPLVHNYPADFYYYLSYIQQGREGSLLVTSRYTPEAFPRQFAFTFFPLLGGLANLLRLSNQAIYTLARALSGAALLAAAYWFYRRALASRRGALVALVIAIIGAPAWFMAGGIIHQWGEFWTGFDVLLRLTFLPHHLLANFLFIVALTVLSQGLANKDYKLTLLAALLSAAAGWTLPAVAVVLLTTILLAALIQARTVVKLWAHLVTFAVVTIVPLAALLWLGQSVFPWTEVARFERSVAYSLTAIDFLPLGGFHIYQRGVKTMLVVELSQYRAESSHAVGLDRNLVVYDEQVVFLGPVGEGLARLPIRKGLIVGGPPP